MPPTAIFLAPYNYIKNQRYGELVVQISKKAFAGIQYQEGKTIFNFDGCTFDKVIIENKDAIDFDGNDITLSLFRLLDQFSRSK